jgi:hypothetical protein
MTAARRTQLARLGIWIGLATVAVLTAGLAARTETGLRRIATLFSPDAAEPARSAKITMPQFANRQYDQDGEQRRLTEAIRTLAADRDRLAARVGALERNLDDVTGSIPPAAANPAPGAPLPARPLAQIPAASSPPQTVTPAAPFPPPAPPNRVAAGHLATGAPTPSESVATKTEFGIDVGGNTSVEGLRTLWTSLKASQPALFEGLRPLIAVRDGQKPGTVELRLIAGPIANAGMAARMCAALSAMNQNCQPAVFDGQRLALQ